MIELPAGWEICTLKDVGEIVTGKTPDTKQAKFYGESFPFIRPGDLDIPQQIFHTATRLSESGIEQVPEIPAQSVVVTCIGNLGKVGLTITRSATNQQINSIIPERGVDPSFLFFYARTLKPWLEENSSATTIAIVNKGVFGGAPVKLPPSCEQERIAKKLDQLLAQVDTLGARIDAIPTLIKRFRESVLRAAVSGRLTEDWRTAHADRTAKGMLSGFEALPPPARYKTRSEAYIHGVCATSVGMPGVKLVDAWEWVPLVQVARMESGHTPSREVPDYWGGDVPWIGIKDARLSHEKTIYATQQNTNQLGLENSAARLLPVGTVCISRTASVGYVVKMGAPMATSQDFVNWVPSRCVHADWLKWLFVAEKESLFRFGKGTTHTTVYFPEWLSLHVALPHIDEQIEIAARVQGLLDLADRLTERVAAAKQHIDTLTQSILAKAFRGELVSQDPNDEPASVLLERIRAQRSVTPKPKRGRSKT